ncbi:hypothetical protein GDO78_009122 [Eleutherodactylus coqui]|uniref:Secreted protein n=1 Tax=Eleutherodactylus coqui TaxID=57060 RepID=A0A8J6K8Z8_ELECQ|nr:hypothetical protein GDO78_009122 [Eleutherodactylus coqui]
MYTFFAVVFKAVAFFCCIESRMVLSTPQQHHQNALLFQLFQTPGDRKTQGKSGQVRDLCLLPIGLILGEMLFNDHFWDTFHPVGQLLAERCSW